MNFYVFDIGSICVHGEELLRQFTFHQKYREQSPNETDVRHIWKVSSGTIRWDFLECLKSAGKVLNGNNFGLVNDEEVISLWHAKVYVFSDSVLCLGKMSENPLSNVVWEDKLTWFKDPSTIQNIGHNRRRTDGIRVEYFSEDSQHWSLSTKSKNSWAKWANPNNSKDELSSCRCSMTSCVEIKTMKRNVLLIPHLCLHSQKDFQQDVGHSSNLGQKQSGTQLTKKDQGENGIESLNWWWSNSEKADTQFSEQRVRCLEERSKAKEVENYRYTSALVRDRLKLIFFTIISVNQLSIYGAVSDVCEEYSICQTNTGRPVAAEQSDTFFAPADLLIMTPTSSTEILAQENLLQKHEERVENLPQPDQLIKICIDAGFLKRVEVGQYFMTKHTDEFLQFAEPVTCREKTLPRDDKSADTKGWTTSYLQGKHGVEIRIESVNNENFHSWVRISHGLNKLVTDLSNNKENDNEQETSTTKNDLRLQADPRLKQKPRRPSTTCPSLRIIPILEIYWTRNSDWSSLPSGKNNEHNSSTRRITSRRRWSDRILETEGWSSEQIRVFSILVWWCMEEQDGRRRRQQQKISILHWPVRTWNSLPSSSLRSFRTQFNWSFTAGQCFDSEHFLRVHLSYWMCSQFALHHQLRIDSGRTNFWQRKTDGILYGCESHE